MAIRKKVSAPPKPRRWVTLGVPLALALVLALVIWIHVRHVSPLHFQVQADEPAKPDDDYDPESLYLVLETVDTRLAKGHWRADFRTLKDHGDGTPTLTVQVPLKADGYALPSDAIRLCDRAELSINPVKAIGPYQFYYDTESFDLGLQVRYGERAFPFDLYRADIVSRVSFTRANDSPSIHLFVHDANLSVSEQPTVIADDWDTRKPARDHFAFVLKRPLATRVVIVLLICSTVAALSIAFVEILRSTPDAPRWDAFAAGTTLTFGLPALRPVVVPPSVTSTTVLDVFACVVFGSYALILSMWLVRTRSLSRGTTTDA
jgi:hypothetical protein